MAAALYSGLSSAAAVDKVPAKGPAGQLSPVNPRITIPDDSDSVNLDKVVSVNTMQNPDWRTLPVSGNGQGRFKFFDSFGGAGSRVGRP